MGVGSGPGVAQDAGDGGRRRRQTFVRRVGGWRGDADDGGGEIRLPAVQLQVFRLRVQAGTAVSGTETQRPPVTTTPRDTLSKVLVLL